MNERMPKTMLCRKCGIKPKREIISWSFGDSDDELFLQHKCNGESTRFPNRGRFTDVMVSGQEIQVVKAWNEEQK